MPVSTLQGGYIEGACILVPVSWPLYLPPTNLLEKKDLLDGEYWQCATTRAPSSNYKLEVDSPQFLEESQHTLQVFNSLTAIYPSFVITLADLPSGIISLA